MKNNTLTITTQALTIIAFVILITFSPSIHFIPHIEWHDCQRIIQLLLLTLILINQIPIGLNKENVIQISPYMQLGFFTILVLSITSTLVSIEPRFAVIEITIFIALCFLSLTVARLSITYKEIFIKYLSYILVAGICLYMASFYTGYFAAIVTGKPIAWPEPFFGFSNIRLFQEYQLWGLGLVCLPLLAFDLKKSTCLLLSFGLTCWWVLLYYAASRGVILGWLLAAIITAILYKKQAWPFLRLQLTSAAFGLMGYLLLFKAIPYWLALSAQTSTASVVNSPIVTHTVFRATTYDRLDLWKVAYVMMENFPLLGVGPMHFYNYNSFGTHPHNSVLQIASEWGLPATAIILWVVSYGALCWYKRFNASQLQNKPKLHSNLAIILFFTAVANGAYSLVEGVIIMPISQVLMFTIIGLMIGQYTSGSWFMNARAPQRKFYFRPILAGITLVFLVLSVKPELVRGLTNHERYFQPGERAFSMGPGTINPRIWMQQRRVEATKK